MSATKFGAINKFLFHYADLDEFIHVSHARLHMERFSANVTFVQICFLNQFLDMLMNFHKTLWEWSLDLAE